MALNSRSITRVVIAFDLYRLDGSVRSYLYLRLSKSAAPNLRGENKRYHYE